MKKNTDRKIRRKILVVDDELVNRRLLGFIVSRDYDVLYAENGVEALEKIKENRTTLSLVLLDLLMPELNGFELLTLLGNDPELSRIPVIVLTSEKSAEVEALTLGAVDFISKPYDMPEVILARINRSVELAEDKILISESERDELTGLYTKTFFYQYASQYDRYYPEMKMDAVYVNINRFHLVNELYGRAYGDTVLENIASVIKEVTAGETALGCRCEADTFCIYLPHRDDYDSIMEKYSSELNLMSGGVNISVRVGIYENADIHMDIGQRFDRAVTAAGRLRAAYKSTLAFYDEKVSERELFNEKLIMEMDTALENKQFQVYYQPKYDITGDSPRLASAEALIRWKHPEHGLISPGVFIPLFEENGLVQKLDRYVWSEAAAQIAAWREKFNITLPVSVNVSRMDIYDPKLIDLLTGLLEKNKLSAKNLLLEITESAYTDNSDQIIKKADALRDLGFRIEMDDFGSGYSSLNMLAALPVDALKLDMQFVRHITHDPKSMKMVELILEIADFLSVPVIAEGVETREQYELLKKAGCQIIQGYYFSKPLPAEEFEKLFEK